MWINYFVDVVLNAQIHAKTSVDKMLRKTKFFDRFKDTLNDRQLEAVKRMMDDFEGGMTAKKYMVITKSSKSTATRELQVLVDLDVFLLEGGGRSTHYHLNI